MDADSVLIDDRGKFLIDPDGDIVGYAVSLGFIHIRLVDKYIIVSLRPNLVRSATMAGAFSVIKELRPKTIIIIANGNWHRVGSVACAINGIDKLVTAANERSSSTSEEDRAARSAAGVAGTMPLSIARRIVAQHCRGTLAAARLPNTLTRSRG